MTTRNQPNQASIVARLEVSMNFDIDDVHEDAAPAPVPASRRVSGGAAALQNSAGSGGGASEKRGWNAIGGLGRDEVSRKIMAEERFGVKTHFELLDGTYYSEILRRANLVVLSGKATRLLLLQPGAEVEIPKYIGVKTVQASALTRPRFIARVYNSSRVVHLGSFEDPVEAAVAFDYATTYLRGRDVHAGINFPGSPSDCRFEPPIDPWPLDIEEKRKGGVSLPEFRPVPGDELRYARILPSFSEVAAARLLSQQVTASTTTAPVPYRSVAAPAVSNTAPIPAPPPRGSRSSVKRSAEESEEEAPLAKRDAKNRPVHTPISATAVAPASSVPVHERDFDAFKDVPGTSSGHGSSSGVAGDEEFHDDLDEIHDDGALLDETDEDFGGRKRKRVSSGGESKRPRSTVIERATAKYSIYALPFHLRPRSTYLGVVPSPQNGPDAKKWAVRLNDGTSIRNIGFTDDQVEAAVIYDKEVRRVRGKKAVTNFGFKSDGSIDTSKRLRIAIKNPSGAIIMSVPLGKTPEETHAAALKVSVEELRQRIQVDSVAQQEAYESQRAKAKVAAAEAEAKEAAKSKKFSNI
jgi:hypothetical protein